MFTLISQRPVRAERVPYSRCPHFRNSRWPGESRTATHVPLLHARWACRGRRRAAKAGQQKRAREQDARLANH